jgi:hypothetical protein
MLRRMRQDIKEQYISEMPDNISTFVNVFSIIPRV